MERQAPPQGRARQQGCRPGLDQDQASGEPAANRQRRSVGSRQARLRERDAGSKRPLAQNPSRGRIGGPGALAASLTTAKRAGRASRAESRAEQAEQPDADEPEGEELESVNLLAEKEPGEQHRHSRRRNGDRARN